MAARSLTKSCTNKTNEVLDGQLVLGWPAGNGMVRPCIYQIRATNLHRYRIYDMFGMVASENGLYRSIPFQPSISIDSYNGDDHY